jgi:hypothetical protein
MAAINRRSHWIELRLTTHDRMWVLFLLPRLAAYAAYFRLALSHIHGRFGKGRLYVRKHVICS